MSWQAWLTAAVITGMLCALASGRAAMDAAVLTAVLVLALSGVLDAREAVQGFANPGVLTVGFLYVLSAGLSRTGALTMLTSRLLGRPRNALEAQARLVIPVTISSAFINNTPIVAMFLPVLAGWARRAGLSPSRLYLPLSYAAILGGVCTLIGTSTNVVVAGLARQYAAGHPGSGLDSIGMFTITVIGLPVAAAGVAYVLLFGRVLLPERLPPDAPASDSKRGYSTAMRVDAGSPVVGKTVEQAGLRRLPGLFLSRIERPSETLIAVSPAQVLRENDLLVFVGNLDSVIDLQRVRGLSPAADEAGEAVGPRHARKLTEAVIAPASPLVGRSIRESAFRTRYEAVIIAVHRHGHRLTGKIGDIVLRPGDTLVIEADPDFAQRHRGSSDFYLVSELEGETLPRHDRAWAAIGVLAIVVAMLSLAGTEVPVLGVRVPAEVIGAMCGAALMVLLRCCSAAQARDSVHWQVLLVIAASMALGTAMEKTGLAATIAGSMSGVLDAVGAERSAWAVFAVVYASTWLFTAIMNNNSAGVLMFPIAVRLAEQSGLPALPVVLCVMVAASCEFISPIGYQTNLMVMGPGGYRVSDYVRYGGPLNVLCAVVCVAVCTMIA